MKELFRKTLFAIVFLTGPLSLLAQQVSKDEAMQKAQAFFSKEANNHLSVRKAPRKAPKLVLANDSRELYVFNDEANGGYVVISGDERMPDVLGYSYDGHFDAENLPYNMKAWLEGYAEQVKYLQTHPEAKAATRSEAERAPVSPLLQTEWDQWNPYNDQCPEVGGFGRCPTGCVATAMAQIMNYHQWPEQTTKPIPGYTDVIDVSGCPVTSIDWDNMLPRYDQYSPEQGNAVATLMKLCGTAVKMQYWYDKSSASRDKCVGAFYKYFDYSSGSVSMEDYDLDEWCQLLYDELANGFPILYGGQPDGEGDGHAFVLDGYDNGGYFHINWGWGGSQDDYFLLTDLTPKNGSDRWNFNYRQTAVLEIRPYKSGIPNMYAELEGETLTFYYDGEGKRSGNIYSKGDLQAMNDFDDWFDLTTLRYEGRPKVTEMVIDPSLASYTPITSLGCFMNWYDLKTIKGLEHLNTLRIKSMYGMFENCSSLESLDLSGFNTKMVADMGCMFMGCSSLESLDLSGFNTEKVTNMREMFMGCSSLTSLDLSNFNTDNVTAMAYMFGSCSSLTSLDLSSFKTDKVTDMYFMFNNCKSLTNLNLSSFNTANVTDMSGMFNKCGSLTSLDLSRFNTDNVTNMRYMFNECYSLQSLDLSGFNPENVTNMTYMFSSCNSLTSLDLSNFNTKNVTDMSWMFSDCWGLTYLDVSNFNTESVTDMSLMFANCTSLTNLDVSSFNTENVTYMNGMFNYCPRLKSIDVSGFNTKSVTDMSGMFKYCEDLTSIDVSGFLTDNVTDMGGMFSGCNSLTSIDVSGFNTANVTDMSSMFISCKGLTSLDVSGFRTDNVTDMSGMFAYSSNLKTINLKGINTQNVTNMLGMFNNCSSLSEIDLSGFDTGNVTDMQYLFFGCSSLKSLDLNSFNTGNVTDMNSMFGNCGSLADLDLSNFNTSNVKDMSGMFERCFSLTSLDLGSFSASQVTDMSSMFEWCSYLESIDLSHFNTSKARNMSRMFYGCYRLKELDLSDFHTKSVTNMEKMFWCDVDLTTIYVSEGWKTENVEQAEEMFNSCERLKGGEGTVFSYAYDGIDYARIDGGPENPGYLTYKESTDVQQPVVEEGVCPAVFSLSGIKVRVEGKGLEGLPAGVYIVGGKKVVIK